MNGGADVRPARAPARRPSANLRRGASAWALLGVLLSGALAACDDLCVRDSDCPPGLTCQPSGLCDAPPIPLPGGADAAPPDATTPSPPPSASPYPSR